MTTLTTIRRTALHSLIPPPRIALSQWIEQNIKLPEGVSALPGAIRLYPYQREIAVAHPISLTDCCSLYFSKRASAARRARLPRRTSSWRISSGMSTSHSPPTR
jgi:hypothetical protein